MTARRIDHVVVLMLENRSFDNLFGFLDHPSPAFPGLDPERHPNRLDPTDDTSPAYRPTPDGEYWLDPPDPPHSHGSIMEQLAVKSGRTPRMDGFLAAAARKALGREERPFVHWWRIEILLLVVALAPAAVTAWLARGASVPISLIVYLVLAALLSGLLYYAKRFRVDPVPTPSADVAERARQVLRCMAPDKIPVLATLAREFAVCTRWHCSVPGETWPNRNFVHAATSEGAVNIEAGFYHAPTIFDLLEAEGATWHIYYDGPPQVWAFKDLWSDPGRHCNWYEFDAFQAHARSGSLPGYAFVEPRHMRGHTNSQHPGNNLRTPSGGESDFERGERLVATIYEALRRNDELFRSTLFVVTYDEHGGFFDHVPPPRAPAPRLLGRRGALRRFVSWFVEQRRSGFAFRLLGPRVPAVVVSPWIDRETVDQTLYDHTSVIATLRTLFAPGSKPLTRRDRRARALDHLVAARGEPRAADDVPDLSRFVREGAVGDTAISVAAEAAGEIIANQNPDDFTAQLAALSDLVRAELVATGPPAPGPRSAVGGRIGEDAAVAAAARFGERARSAREHNV